jgi:hypothetical protein
MTPTGILTGKVEKGSQESERADLNPKAETIVIPTTLGDELTIFVVEAENSGRVVLLTVRRCSVHTVVLVPR